MMKQHEKQEGRPRKPDIIERHERFGEFHSDLKRIIDPQRAELRDVVATQYYVPRKLDIERMIVFATLDDSKTKPVHILDLGGGRGFLAKLLVDKLHEAAKEAIVVDVDTNKKALASAKKFYKDTPGLQFVASDTEQEAGEIFNADFNLIILSWGHPDDISSRRYSETVKKLRPSIFTNVGEVGQEFTTAFNPGGDYIKFAEWFSPTAEEVATGRPLHYTYGLEQTGSNLFEVYVRRDVDGDSLWRLRATLKDITSDTAGKYNWEEELDELYPLKALINFDEDSFLQK